MQLVPVQILVLLFLGFGLTAWGQAFVPRSPECIAPAAPGGGWDFTCRSVGQFLYELRIVPQPIKVTNMVGAGVAWPTPMWSRNVVMTPT